MDNDYNYSVEFVNHGELVNNSATYFMSVFQVMEYCKKCTLESCDDFYVTYRDEWDTWYFDKLLTTTVNNLYK